MGRTDGSPGQQRADVVVLYLVPNFSPGLLLSRDSKLFENARVRARSREKDWNRSSLGFAK